MAAGVSLFWLTLTSEMTTVSVLQAWLPGLNMLWIGLIRRQASRRGRGEGGVCSLVEEQSDPNTVNTNCSQATLIIIPPLFIVNLILPNQISPKIYPQSLSSTELTFFIGHIFETKKGTRLQLVADLKGFHPLSPQIVMLTDAER